MSNNMTSTIDEETKHNLDEAEQELDTSSAYFKPKPGTTYVIKMDPQHDKIIPRENDRFKDATGKPIKRYECKITHVNNGREQLWDTSKTTCQQIIEQLRKGFTVLKIIRTGADRSVGLFYRRDSIEMSTVLSPEEMNRELQVTYPVFLKTWYKYAMDSGSNGTGRLFFC